MDIEHWTVHDLRRTSASQMAALGTQRLVISKILNHTDSNVTAIYDRYSYLDEKREALDRWSNYISKITSHLETTPASPVTY